MPRHHTTRRTVTTGRDEADRPAKVSAVAKGLLSRAQGMFVSALKTALLRRCFAAWREPVWRSRRNLRRDMNVLGYRVSQLLNRLSLLREVYASWRSCLGERSRNRCNAECQTTDDLIPAQWDSAGVHPDPAQVHWQDLQWQMPLQDHYYWHHPLPSALEGWQPHHWTPPMPVAPTPVDPWSGWVDILPTSFSNPSSDASQTARPHGRPPPPTTRPPTPPPGLHEAPVSLDPPPGLLPPPSDWCLHSFQ
jgi:hypothetical protein